MNLGLRSWGTALVAMAALSACNVDPGGSPGFTDPCYELQGDLTCQSLYNALPYCSICEMENQGCVMLPPALSCLPGGGSTGGTDTSEDDESTAAGSSTTGMADDTVGLDTTSGSSTGEPPCEAEGELDPGCMELDPTRPFCVDTVCVGCDLAGGDDFCGGLDPLTPACDPMEGACLGCGEVGAFSCGSESPVCDESGACLSCTTHDQCPDSACHLAPDDPLLGQCFPPDEVVWVDNSASCPGLGTMEEPACSLQDAAAAVLPGDVVAIRVVASGFDYQERAAFSGEMTVAIVGDGEPVIAGNPGQQAATLLFDEGVTAYVDGLRLEGNPLTHGVTCNFSQVYVEDTRILNNDGWGVFDFDPCTLDVRRTIIVGNEDGGIRLSGGTLELANAAIGLNGIGGNSTGVRLIDGDVNIVYSTIAGNNGAGADSIECTNSTGTLRNSIVTGVDDFSVELDCFPLLMDHNALDSANFASGTNIEVEPYNPIYYNGPAEGDFTLSAPPLTPFGDVALWMKGDPEFDGDGTPRPTDGSFGYAGVDEP